MALWIDKYRPREMSKLTFHKEQSEKLSSLVKAGDFSHLLFCGPAGAGKRTRINCLLKNIYGKCVENVHVETHHFSIPSGKKLQIFVVNSNFHIELTPSDVGVYDRVIVQEVIKEMAQVQQLNRASQKEYKVVVLLEAENLTKEAQHSLRRTMEKYAANCKIILCCESASRIIEPLRSRCMVIRVPAPSDEELLECVENVCTRERVQASQEWLRKLTEKSDGNLRRALCLLECSVSQNGHNLDKQPIVEPEWEVYIRDIAKLIVQSPTQNGLLDVRNRFYELLCRCIPSSVIFTHLILELSKIREFTSSIFPSIVSTAAEYEHSTRLGSKDIIHLEAFVATVMSLIVEKRFQKIK
ncbi:hypothetical protein ACQ4LE_006663 [Meloidogyne hapla]|uniref:AAA domain-containing protein n=1 Tax=Meloidogyne hapla TaxID=6305 RepID=A0A1I8BK71_MELHA